MANNTLELIKDDADNFKSVYPELINKVTRRKLKEVEPKIDEITSVTDIIINFVKEKKRKIYGGYAINQLVMTKDKKLGFYTDLDIPDIDFYSPEPLSDLKELCDRIMEAGFKPVEGREAQHKETYTVYVNYQKYCDITYMPANIYHKVRFIQLDGFMIVHPWFIMIDYFRMFTDPMVSYWRLEKHFARYRLLEKLYPLPLISKPIDFDKHDNPLVYKAMNLLFDEVSNYSSILFTGFYAYNYYLKVSNFQNSNSNYKFIDIPFYEVYSTNYVEDGLKIINFIKTLPEDIRNNVGFTEYYPFFNLYGHNTIIYYKDGDMEIPILYLYSNNRRCIPYKHVELIKFLEGGKIEEVKNKKINIGSFDFNVLHALIMLVKVRVDDDNDWNDILYKYINAIVAFRNYFLEKHKITIFDESIFQSFVIDCIGEIVLPERESRILGEVRRKKGKPVKYIYNPEKSKLQGNYVFLNSSGNIINNKKNLKLIESNKNINLAEELEKEETFVDEDEKVSDSE